MPVNQDQTGMPIATATTTGGLPPPPGGAGVMPPGPPGMQAQTKNTAPWRKPPPTATSYGGQNTVGASAGPADYEGVQGFADQAYQQARRDLDPMQEQMQRRTQQDLINKGVDPSSPQGMAMLDQENRNISDQNSTALFGALQFGQGIQNQMFGQDLANTQQAGNMQQAKWQYDLGNKNLDMNQQGQDFNQMIGLEGLQFRDRMYGDKRSDYQDALTMSLMGMSPVPGVVGYDPTSLAQQQKNMSGGGGFLGSI